VNPAHHGNTKRIADNEPFFKYMLAAAFKKLAAVVVYRVLDPASPGNRPGPGAGDIIR
jgi:hypothetical protein